MSSLFVGGSRPPQSPFVYAPDAPIRRDAFRFDAWARALGEGDPAPRRKPNRGQLPDVDFSRVAPAPREVSRFVRLWRAIVRPSRAPPAAQAATDDAGKTDEPLHIKGARVAPFSPGAARAKGDFEGDSRAA